MPEGLGSDPRAADAQVRAGVLLQLAYHLGLEPAQGPRLSLFTSAGEIRTVRAAQPDTNAYCADKA